MKTQIEIYDQTLRDGLMSRPLMSVEDKLVVIEGLLSIGIVNIELSRFPLDGTYKQFSNTKELLKAVYKFRNRGKFSILAMTTEGIKEALEFKEFIHEIHTPCFISDAYNEYAFGKADWKGAIKKIKLFKEICSKHRIKLTVGIGTFFGCPITQKFNINSSLNRYLDVYHTGVDCIMLGDTAGTAFPQMVKEILKSIKLRPKILRVHFHDTFGKALLNSWVAINNGVTAIDSSLLGLGGEPHPYFMDPLKINNGNCATEDIYSLIINNSKEGSFKLMDKNSRIIFRLCRWLAGKLAEPLPHGRSSFAELKRV